jgi:hypothetical protein
MRQAGEDRECGSMVTDPLSSGRVSRVNEVSIVARGIGRFEGVLANGTQFPRDGYEVEKRPPIHMTSAIFQGLPLSALRP